MHQSTRTERGEPAWETPFPGNEERVWVGHYLRSQRSTFVHGKVGNRNGSMEYVKRQIKTPPPQLLSIMTFFCAVSIRSYIHVCMPVRVLCFGGRHVHCLLSFFVKPLQEEYRDRPMNSHIVVLDPDNQVIYGVDDKRDQTKGSAPPDLSLSRTSTRSRRGRSRATGSSSRGCASSISRRLCTAARARVFCS